MISQEDVIYFLFTDRFKNGDRKNDYHVNPDDPRGCHGGDFAGIIQKIPYLKNLGVTAVWITPVYQNIEYTQDPKFRYRAYHGYWPLDFERVDRRLYSRDPEIPDGDMRHLAKLVDVLHNNDLKLILDMVINHTGYEHPWQQERPNWFHPPGYEDDIRKYIYGLPDLDLSNPDVIDYFIRNIISWIQKGKIDGIRMDAVKHVDKPFFYHLKASLRGACPGIHIFGEAFDYDPSKVSQYQNFFDFDSMLDFPLRNAIFDVFVNEESFFKIARPRISAEESSGVLDLDLRYNNPYQLVTFLDNHDVPRFFSQLLAHFGDQGWGRGIALRTYKAALAFLLTCRGIPQIYYGDEIGMEGWNDPDNRRDMPWDIFKGNSPDRVIAPESREIFDHVKKVIKLRTNNNCLKFGSLLTLWVDDLVMVYLRYYEDNIVICAFNNGREPMEEPLYVPYGSNENIPHRIRGLLSTSHRVYSALETSNYIEFDGDNFSLKLKGKDVEIFVCR